MAGETARPRGIGMHVVTALATLGVAWLLMRGRDMSAGRVMPVLQIPGTGAGYRVPQTAPPPLPAELLKELDAEEQVNVRVYAAVNRGVVNITAAGKPAGFFGEEVGGGTGSGFVIDRKGHILTNYHVVEDSDRVGVTFHDGETLEGEVIGRDPSNDVAVVRVDASTERLVPLALGDSSRLLVGQKVLAVGNPFGLERTLTTGIISSLDRSMRAKNGRVIKGIIQTDAAINPGNSGGPLLNTRGQVIGITTAIYSQVGQSAGIGFAVPINTITRILQQLVEQGRVIRADIGLTRVLKTDAGLMLIDFVEGGPADAAGMQRLGYKVVRTPFGIARRPDPESADVIVSVDGKPVRTVEDLLSEVEAHQPGETVRVGIIRQGKTVEVPVKLGRS